MNKRVFIVEDDRTSEVVLSNLVHSVDAGARIDWEDNAEQAIRRIEREMENGRAYDLIIVDIFLSGVTTGIDLWRICQERFPTTPVLVTSNLTREKFFETIGPNSIAPAFLPKPFRLGACRRMLEAALS